MLKLSSQGVDWWQITWDFDNNIYVLKQKVQTRQSPVYPHRGAQSGSDGTQQVVFFRIMPGFHTEYGFLNRRKSVMFESSHYVSASGADGHVVSQQFSPAQVKQVADVT